MVTMRSMVVVAAAKHGPFSKWIRIIHFSRVIFLKRYICRFLKDLAVTRGMARCVDCTNLYMALNRHPSNGTGNSLRLYFNLVLAKVTLTNCSPKKLDLILLWS